MDNLFKTFTSTLQTGLQSALDDHSDVYSDEYGYSPRDEPASTSIDKEEIEKYFFLNKI